MTVSRYEEVLTRIDAFLADLELLVRRAALQSVQLALSGEPAPESATTPIIIAAPSMPVSPSTTPGQGKVTGRTRPTAMARAVARTKEPVLAKGKRPLRAAARKATPAPKALSGRRALAQSGKRTAKQLGTLMESALKYIHRHPGSRMEQIAEGMRVPSKELTLPLRHLKDGGRLKVKGQKRATSYFAK